MPSRLVQGRRIDEVGFPQQALPFHPYTLPFSPQLTRGVVETPPTGVLHKGKLSCAPVHRWEGSVLPLKEKTVTRELTLLSLITRLVPKAETRKGPTKRPLH